MSKANVLRNVIHYWKYSVGKKYYVVGSWNCNIPNDILSEPYFLRTYFHAKYFIGSVYVLYYIIYIELPLTGLR